ncbi:MAG: LamG domain-containing protein [Caldilineaceae bacterium]
MCEDDNNNAFDCDGSDEIMGSMVFFPWQPAIASTQIYTFSDRPEDPSCSYSFGFGWPESAQLYYTLDKPTLPFVGGVQNVTVFNTYKDQAAVDGLRRGVTYLADFRFDEAPDSSRFEDFSSFHEATCNKAAGQCPASGLAGLDEQALDFDGVNDYLAADTLAQAAAENSALTFGAWVKPDSINGVSAVMGFNKANGGFGNLLLLQADGSNHFKPVYYDPVVGSVIGSSFQMGGWFHVAVTIDSSNNGTLYVNSQNVATFSTTARPEVSGKFSIGQSWNQGAIYYPFNGMIDRAFLGKKAFNEIELELEMKRAPFKRWTMDADNLPLNLNNGADYLLESGVRGDSLKLDDDAYAQEAGFETGFPFVQRTSGGPFTISIWLKGDTLKTLSGGSLNQPIFAIGAEGASNSQLRLSLLDGVPVVNHRQANTTKTLSASQSLIPNVWQQVTLRHDAGAMSLFVNGTLIQTVSNWDGAAIAPGPVGITLGSFQGLLDEFTVYQAALTDREIREQYNRQNAWMEDQHSLRLTVSVEPPQVSLPIESSYFAQKDTQILIKTSSQFAQTMHADLLIQGTTRAPAAAVLDAEAGSAWMATFTPTLGEHVYTLQARATMTTWAIRATGQRHRRSMSMARRRRSTSYRSSRNPPG